MIYIILFYIMQVVVLKNIKNFKIKLAKDKTNTKFGVNHFTNYVKNDKMSTVL